MNEIRLIHGGPGGGGAAGEGLRGGEGPAGPASSSQGSPGGLAAARGGLCVAAGAGPTGTGPSVGQGGGRWGRERRLPLPIGPGGGFLPVGHRSGWRAHWVPWGWRCLRLCWSHAKKVWALWGNGGAGAAVNERREAAGPWGAARAAPPLEWAAEPRRPTHPRRAWLLSGRERPPRLGSAAPGLQPLAGVSERRVSPVVPPVRVCSAAAAAVLRFPSEGLHGLKLYCTALCRSPAVSGRTYRARGK